MGIGNTRRTLTVLSFAPNDVVTATGNETGVDLQDYEGCLLYTSPSPRD